MEQVVGNIWSVVRRLLKQEDGQNLVEYALIIALITFGTTATVKTLDAGIRTTFTNVSAILAAE